MSIIRRILLKYLGVFNHRRFATHAESLYTRDYNFKYFRNKNDYKNSVIQLIDDFSECKLAGPGYSFLVKEQDGSSDGFFYHLMQRSNVMKLTTPQLKEILSLMANSKIDTIKHANALKYVDEKCALSAERWPLDLSLYVMDAWFIIWGPRAFRKYYYSVVTSVWSRKLKRCSRHNLILMLYFVGMSKTAPPFLMEMLEDKLESYVTDLTNEELAIAFLSFFKTSSVIKSQPLLKKSCKVAKKLMQEDERFHLISILKGLRLSKHYDAKVIENLLEYIQKEHTFFNFIECTNFLAVFASQNIYCPGAYDSLENQSIALLSSEDPTDFDAEVSKIHPSKRSRVKDIARFLWAVASVGHELKDKSLSFISSILNSRLGSGEFDENSAVLVDCMQSLILLNHYDPNLMEYVLDPLFKSKIARNYKAKPKYQLYFVYRSAYIELGRSKDIDLKFASHIPKTLQEDVEERNGFQDLINYFADTHGGNSFHVCFIIPHIMISGIVLTSKVKESKLNRPINESLQPFIEDGILSKSVSGFLEENRKCICIEILDPSVCVKNSTEPLNLMKAKIRQLQKMNIEVITLTPGEISSLKIADDFDRILKIANISV